MISIIIVNYRVKRELFECIGSVYASKPKTPFEIIVVDNDEKKTIEKDLRRKFPKVVYVPNENKGFGQGNNVGASYARGNYLFFLNPDTKLLNNSIDALAAYLNKHKDTAVVAPLLFDNKNDPFDLQGVRELTPLRAIFSLSFLNKIFPQNKIYRDYYLFDWDKKSIKEVDAVPGTAFVVRKNVFEKIGGFDEKFFLYFEEFDLCKRIQKLGYTILINPEAKVFHSWGESTKKRNDIEQIFRQSRFYYFKKHFGLIKAIMTEIILRINKYSAMLFLIVIAGLFLRLFRIEETMPFISDQGWFYLSARDLLLSGEIPLVGIASSHPWLHQGAYWTYMLAGIFSLLGFNPINGAYLSTALDLAAILLLFKLTSSLFNQRAGIIASLLYATSPLIIFNTRMPYHTSPIPLFTILFIFSLYKWVKGYSSYLPLIIISLVCLYNFELATIPFLFIFIITLLYGIWKKKKWANDIRNKKMMLATFLSFVIPMLPILIYDAGHKFPQTLGFIAWMGYRILVIFGYPPLHPEIASPSVSEFLDFTFRSYTQLIFPLNHNLATVILAASFIFFYFKVVKNILSKKYKTHLVLLALVITVSFLGFFAAKIPSHAYLPMLFPGVILLLAFTINELLVKLSSIPKYIALIFILGIAVINGYYMTDLLLSSPAYFIRSQNFAKQIIHQANGKEYNLKGVRGFEDFTKNYEYLTWWMGKGPSNIKQQQIFIIDGDKIVEKKL